MSRSPRIDVPSYPQHLMVRGNNRGEIFTCDLERYYFMAAVQQALVSYPCDVHAFVLMTNHIHLLATGRQEGSISGFIQDIGRRFVRFVNKRRRRTGTLFEGRFRSSLVETDRYLLTCMRYIEMNPVRAGMVAHPAEYGWSSYAANRSGSPLPPLVPHPTYLALGSTPVERGTAYLRLFDRPVTEDELVAIRESLRESRVLGGIEFQTRLAKALGQPIVRAQHGGKRAGQGRKRIKGSDLELTP